MRSRSIRWLDKLETLGNRLPDPASLFFLGLLAVMLLSAVASAFGWQVVRPGNAAVADVVTATSLMSGDGIWWLFSHLVQNFIQFPPLGLVLVSLLGIGVAERSGLLPALLSRLLRLTPAALLDPMTVFIGVLSSAALDAGYVVLPPLTAVLYLAAGRSPLTGIAVVTAGITAGFSANLFLTGLDPLLAGLSTAGAQVLDAQYQVAITANWWFMVASTFALTLAGWAVARFVLAPRLDSLGVGCDRPQGALTTTSNPFEGRGLKWAGAALVATLIILAVMAWVPGWPLYGPGERFPRWMEVMVPLILVVFLVPGIAYGIGAGTIRSDRALVGMMSDTLKGMGPYIVLAFFAAQFIEAFKYSRLGEMLAIAGGQWLAQAGFTSAALALSFVLVVMGLNLVMGSASAKYALLAPVFVPMFMQAGISPELTQAAYRVGDSVTNGITPFNPYLVIILSFVQRYVPSAGLGTLLSLMVPFALAFALVWSVLLGTWVALGWDLGPAGGLSYPAVGYRS